MLDDPLHDAKVVHHLDKGDEEDDSSQNVGEEPLLLEDGFLIEEEGGTNFGLFQEVGSEEGDPFENLETSVGLEDEEGDGLLEEETNQDRSPGKRLFQIRSVHNVTGMIGTTDRRKSTHHWTLERSLEVNQKVNWKMKRPRTDIARSPYDVPCYAGIRMTAPPAYGGITWDNSPRGGRNQKQSRK